MNSAPRSGTTGRDALERRPGCAGRRSRASAATSTAARARDTRARSDLGMADREGLHRHAAHRVADEHASCRSSPSSTVRTSSARLSIEWPVSPAADSPWPRCVERDGAEAARPAASRNCLAHTSRGERDAVRRTRSAARSPRLDDVELAAVVASGRGVTRRPRARSRSSVGIRRRPPRADRAAATARSPGVQPRRATPGGDAGDDPGRASATLADVHNRSPMVRPRDAGADAGDDLVGDRAEALGPLGGGDLLVALRADEHDLVADLDGGVADVDHQLVHRDDAGDRAAPAADEHLATDQPEVAGHTVGVPRGHGRDAARRAASS